MWSSAARRTLGSALRALLLLVVLLGAQQFALKHALSHLAEHEESEQQHPELPQHSCDLCQSIAGVTSALTSPEFAPVLRAELRFSGSTSAIKWRVSASVGPTHNRDPPSTL